MIGPDLVGNLARDTGHRVHDLGAGELLGALHVLEAWPKRVRVIGLEPKAIELGLELTEPVAAGVPGLIEAIGGYLADWQRADA